MNNGPIVYAFGCIEKRRTFKLWYAMIKALLKHWYVYGKITFIKKPKISCELVNGVYRWKIECIVL
jgi:hypothetical protein